MLHDLGQKTVHCIWGHDHLPKWPYYSIKNDRSTIADRGSIHRLTAGSDSPTAHKPFDHQTSALSSWYTYVDFSWFAIWHRCWLPVAFFWRRVGWSFFQPWPAWTWGGGQLSSLLLECLSLRLVLHQPLAVDTRGEDHGEKPVMEGWGK